MDGPPVAAALPKSVVVLSDWLKRHCILLVTPIFFIVYGFAFFEEGPQAAWFHPYVVASQRMQAGQRIHVIERDAYAYPPAMAMLVRPLAGLPWQASLGCWYAVNVVATCVTFLCAWRLAGALSAARLEGPWPAVFGLSTLAVLRFFGSPLENTQFDMVIAALLLAGCCQLCRGRDWTAGLLLGAAAAMKCTPLLFLPYLLWRGRWRAAVVFVPIALLLNLLPDLIWPQLEGRSYLLDWLQTFVEPTTNTAPGQWHSDTLLNQSLAGMLYRWFLLGFPLSSEALANRNLGGVANTALLRGLVYGAGLMLAAVTLWQFGRPLRRNATLALAVNHGDIATPWTQLRIGVEAAALVCLMLLLSPMSSKAHYVVLILPVLILARRLVERREKLVAMLFTALLFTGPLCAKDLIGKPLGDLSLAWGLPVWFVMICLVGMWSTLGLVRETASGDAIRSTPQVGLTA